MSNSAHSVVKGPEDQTQNHFLKQDFLNMIPSAHNNPEKVPHKKGVEKERL